MQRAGVGASQAGGKGVNISRASVAAGVPSIAVLPAPKDDPFVLELLAAGIDCRPVPHPGDLRVNITITEPDGTTTKLNSPGADHDRRVLADLTEAAAASRPGGRLGRARRVAAARRPRRFYADLVVALRGTGARVAVDTSDAPLRALVDRAARAARRT